MPQETVSLGPQTKGKDMSTKYTKITAMIKGEAEVLYLTDSELERCRNRLGKEGCEDTKVGDIKSIGEIRRMPPTDSSMRRKVLMLS